MRRKIVFTSAAIASLVALTGLSSTTAAGAPDRAAPAAAPAATAAIPTTAPCGALPASSAPVEYEHVAMIIFENKPLKKIVGNTADAPYLNSLVKACSYSKNDLSLSLTSLTNYVALTSGYLGCVAISATTGRCTTEREITTNSAPSVWPQASVSIFELMGSAARQWGESQPTACALESKDLFSVNHTPYQYYTRTQNNLCRQYALPFPSAPADMVSAKFNLIIPNKKNIMHLVPNTTVAQRIQNGDNWAKVVVPQLLASPEYQAGKTAIIITFDEGNKRQFLVPLIIITPYTKVGGVSSVPYNHYSVLKGLQQMVGYDTPLLGHAADAGLNSIRDDALFGLKP